ncbi:hypothetical protein Dda_7064 [Drechslerella dactyloides]|uniref:Uncharacterized protein n=1 Tax=Drechslerella dactyloides TaxID=74499 RepID=A0AAD6IXE5_DREDA|nr:hypothetical protein Dda_7064 [Drechslerella dactyloides]
MCCSKDQRLCQNSDIKHFALWCWNLAQALKWRSDRGPAEPPTSVQDSSNEQTSETDRSRVGMNQEASVVVHNRDRCSTAAEDTADHMNQE